MWSEMCSSLAGYGWPPFGQGFAIGMICSVNYLQLASMFQLGHQKLSVRPPIDCVSLFRSLIALDSVSLRDAPFWISSDTVLKVEKEFTLIFGEITYQGRIFINRYIYRPPIDWWLRVVIIQPFKLNDYKFFFYFAGGTITFLFIWWFVVYFGRIICTLILHLHNHITFNPLKTKD